MKVFLAAITLLHAVGCENKSSELSDERFFEAATTTLESEDQDNQEIEENQESAPIDQGASSIDTAVQETKKNDTENSENIISTSDRSPPIINLVKINGGISHTTSQEVLLGLDVIDAAEMYLTNSPNCASDGEWEAFSGTKDKWKIKNLNAKSTIYAKFRDLSGNETECVSFFIIHDNIPPITTIIDKPPILDNSSSPNFSFTCNEECKYQVRVDEGSWTDAKSPYKLSGLEAGPKKLEVRSIDIAGNIETNPIMYNWTIDQTPPDSPSISISSGADYTSSSSVTLSLNATSATEMYVTNFSRCSQGGEWKAYAHTEASWTLGQTNTTTSVYVKYRDLAGNETACISNSILHDNRSPTNVENLDDGLNTTDDKKSPALSWDASTDAGGSGIDYYEIKVGTSVGDDDIHSPENIGNVTNYTIESLENSLSEGTQYYSSIRSFDLTGNPSEWVSGDGFSFIRPYSIEKEKIQASDKEADDDFGYSVSISGDFALVGAPFEDTGGSDAGAVYVYKLSEDGLSWEQQNKLQANDIQAGDQFGYSVSIAGDFAIVGAPFEDTGGDDAGAVYLYKLSEDGLSWEQQNKLQSNDILAGDQFGHSVSISGDFAIVGAPLYNSLSSDSGAGYFFKLAEDGSSWSQHSKIEPFDGSAGDQFGYSVSISGNSAIVGAPFEDSGFGNAGSGYIFKKSEDHLSWELVNKIQSNDKYHVDEFGTSVSISQNYAIVGVPFEDTGGDYAGSAYIFKESEDGLSWVQHSKIQSTDVESRDYFGYSVSIHNNFAIVGARGERAGGTTRSGSAYVFKESEDGLSWEQQTKIHASDKQVEDYFGSSVSISDRFAIIGSPYEDTGGSRAGSAYIFD